MEENVDKDSSLTWITRLYKKNFPLPALQNCCERDDKVGRQKFSSL